MGTYDRPEHVAREAELYDSERIPVTIGATERRKPARSSFEIVRFRMAYTPAHLIQPTRSFRTMMSLPTTDSHSSGEMASHVRSRASTRPALLWADQKEHFRAEQTTSGFNATHTRMMWYKTSSLHDVGRAVPDDYMTSLRNIRCPNNNLTRQLGVAKGKGRAISCRASCQNESHKFLGLSETGVTCILQHAWHDVRQSTKPTSTSDPHVFGHICVRLRRTYACHPNGGLISGARDAVYSHPEMTFWD
jgi:hypothetical protein